MVKGRLVDKIIDSKFFWVICSLLASLLLWMYITSTEGTEISKELLALPIEFIGETELRENNSLIITGVDVSSMDLEVTGKRREISKIDSSNVVIRVDVSSVRQTGERPFAYTIVYPESVDSSEFTVSYQPRTIINVYFDKLVKKTIDVKGRFLGEVAKDYLMDDIEIEPNTVVITGAEEELELVSHALVTIEREEVVDKTIQTNANYALVDEYNVPVEHKTIELETDQVYVNVPILLTKEIELRVEIIPGGGATAANVVSSFSPQTITLKGDPAELEGLNYLVVGSLDLSNFALTHEETYPIVLPNKTESVTGETEVKVEHRIIGMSTGKFSVTNIETMNKPGEFQVEVLTKSIDVTIRAPSAVLDVIQSTNIRAVVDLADISNTGNLTLPAAVHVDGYTEAGAVLEYKVVVSIKQSED